MSEAGDLAAFRVMRQRVVNPFADKGTPRTVLMVPSMSLDSAGLVKIPGVGHYEERFLVFLHLLRDPGTRMVFVTSERLPDALVDHTLRRFGCTRERLSLHDTGSGEPIPLTRKVLRSPELVRTLRAHEADVLVVFNGSPLERDLAVRLGVPLFAADPDLAHLGSKSGSRKLFREAGVPAAEGAEDLRDVDDVIAALATLRSRLPSLGRAVVKLNDSFGAGGNVLFSFAGAPDAGLEPWIRAELPRRAEFASPPDTWPEYWATLDAMGAVVEEFVTGEESTSPSAQVVVGPTGVTVVSTHDQVLSGQIFVGCTFPAREPYRLEIQEYARRTGESLAAHGVTGLVSVDFVSVRHGDTWTHHALEINLRMGGGTAPYFMLHGMINGGYDSGTATYRAPDGTPRTYYATDRVLRPEYRSLTMDSVLSEIDRVGFDGSTGVTGYMLGALEIGRFGVVSVHHDIPSAETAYRQLVAGVDSLIR